MPPRSSVEAGPAAPPVAETWYARYVEPCGRSSLEISKEREGPYQVVAPTGDGNPVAELRYHVQVDGSFIVTGHFTGETYRDDNCADPRFEVVAFEPDGIVRRVTLPDEDWEEWHYYTEGLPSDRYVPEDYESGPMPRRLDVATCVPATEDDCAPGTVRQSRSYSEQIPPERREPDHPLFVPAVVCCELAPEVSTGG